MISTPARNLCNYMDYYLFADPEGMEGWVGLVGWPIVDTLPTKWSHVNHRSGSSRKGRQSKTDVLTTEPQGIFTIQSAGGGVNFPTSLSTCPTSPLVTANALSVLSAFQLRSVTTSNISETWFTRPLTLSHFGVESRTRISSVGCFISFDVQQYIHIA